MRNIYLLFIAFGLVLMMPHSDAQVAGVEYGQNRVQYHDDMHQWFYYESEHFETFWYGKSKRIGQMIVKIGESEYDKIVDIVEHRAREKIQLFVFSDLTDMNQSNIGIEDVLSSSQEKVKTLGNKVFLYFPEDFDGLRKQVREGIGNIIITQLYNPSALESSFNEEEDLDVPDWFYEGLIAYLGDPWSPEQDEAMKRYLLKKKNLKFKRVARDYPRLAGNSFWYFVENSYGRRVIGNLVYLTKINRDIDEAFFYVFGTNLKQFTNQWETYWEQFYKNELEAAKDDIRSSSDELISTRKTLVDIDAYGDDYALVENRRGLKKVKLYRGNKKKKIFKRGYLNFIQKTDYNYPIFRLDTLSGTAGIIYEFRDKIMLRLVDLYSGDKFEQVLPDRFVRINSFDFFGPDSLLISGFSDGTYDLYMYRIDNRQSQRLTEDIFVEKDVKYAEFGDRKGILFASDRNNEEMNYSMVIDSLQYIYDFDLYFLEIGGQPVIHRLTNTPKIEESNPLQIGDEIFFLSDEHGVENVHSINTETGFGDMRHWLDKRYGIIEVDPDTISNPNTLNRIYSVPQLVVEETAQNTYTSALFPVVDYDIDDGQLYVLMQEEKKTKVFKKEAVPLETIRKTARHSFQNRSSETEEEVIVKDIEGADPNFLSTRWKNTEDLKTIENKLIQKDKKQERPSNRVTADASPLEPIEIDPTDITPYRTQFENYGFKYSLNNNLLFGGLDSYSALDRVFQNQPISIMPHVTMVDLLENHQIELGFRFPATFDGLETYVKYDYLPRRFDHGLVFYRRSQTNNEGVNLTGIESQKSRYITLMGQYRIKYPLDDFNSLRGKLTYRSDNIYLLYSDQRHLGIPEIEGQRIGTGIEFVRDDAMEILPNIRRGSRMKVYAEFIKRFKLSLRDSLYFDSEGGHMTIVGLDLRQYLNFARFSVLALRLAGETSIGSENILYYLGGVDSWLVPSFDSSTPQPTEGNYAYSTTALNLRGFDQNVRNGSSYALFNAEVRIPVFHYLGFIRKSRLGFIKNFQVTGFYDVGTAWVGVNPFDDENPLNTEYIDDPPFEIKVRYERDAIVQGMGWGLRSKLFGYMIRFDYAWGIESGTFLDPKWYIALGYDF